MKTMTTVDAYEKLPSGAHKITFLGDVIAGTFDDEIGALAERIAGDKDASSVEAHFDKRDGKLFVTSLREIMAPPELGGPEEEPPAVTEADSPTEAAVSEPAETLPLIVALSDDALMAELARRLAS